MRVEGRIKNRIKPFPPRRRRRGRRRRRNARRKLFIDSCQIVSFFLSNHLAAILSSTFFTIATFRQRMPRRKLFIRRPIYHLIVVRSESKKTMRMPRRRSVRYLVRKVSLGNITNFLTGGSIASRINAIKLQHGLYVYAVRKKEKVAPINDKSKSENTLCWGTRHVISYRLGYKGN